MTIEAYIETLTGTDTQTHAHIQIHTISYTSLAHTYRGIIIHVLYNYYDCRNKILLIIYYDNCH